MMKRSFDLIFAILLGLSFCPAFMTITILVSITSNGPVLYWSKRVGRDETIFSMPKFRTMRIDTPEVATHLLKESGSYLTPVGSFLRKTSLDEIPQLLSIFRGQMSFVGPRPALFNQDDLIELRREYGLSGLTPGLTGWAQVNGRDEIPVTHKVKLEAEYAHKQSFLFDLIIILKTVRKVFGDQSVSH